MHFFSLIIIARLTTSPNMA